MRWGGTSETDNTSWIGDRRRGYGRIRPSKDATVGMSLKRGRGKAVDA